MSDLRADRQRGAVYDRFARRSAVKLLKESAREFAQPGTIVRAPNEGDLAIAKVYDRRDVALVEAAPEMAELLREAAAPSSGEWDWDAWRARAERLVPTGRRDRERLIMEPVSEEFARLMLLLAEGYGARLTEARIRLYWMALRQVPIQAVQQAADRAVLACRYFPTIAELLQEIRPSGEDAALLAWTAINKAAADVGAWVSLEIEDGRTAAALLAVFASWPQFCREAEDGPALALKRQEFLAAWRQGGRRAAPRRRLAGLCEAGGGYPAGQLRAAVWAARLTADGDVVPERDRPDRPALPVATGLEKST